MKAELKDRLKQAMDYRNLKAIDLVERGNISKAAMSYYLSGRSKPKDDKLYILAKLLDVSEGWLLGYDIPMERSPEQKTVDELAALSERIKKEAEFRDLIIKINHLNPAQFDALKNWVAAFPQQ